jgi:hypothetical protein
MGGGAVAVADPDSGGSAPAGDHGTNASVQGSSTASSPVGNVTDTVRETIQGVTSTPGSGRQPGQQPSTGATSLTEEAGGTRDAGLVAAVPNPVAAVPNAVAPVTNVVAPVTNVVAPVTNVVAPVTNAVAPVTNVVAPVSDVIATGQDMPTSAASAVVPLTQPPSDLSSFLFGIAGVQPAVDGSGGIHGPGLSAAAGASVASPLPLGLPLADIPGVPLAGDAATGVATLDVVALGRASSLSEMAPLAPNGAGPMGEQSFSRDVCEFLIRASLWALAAAALPGVGGLVILTAAGVRVGYRQAKAGFVVRVGIARFAGPGPLGVVRSGPGSQLSTRWRTPGWVTDAPMAPG